MTDLSREAMQLMELTPAWRLRTAPSDEGLSQDRQGLMIVALARDGVSQRLWDSIAKLMMRMGYESAAIQGALVLNAPIADRIDSECASRAPAKVFVFGEELAKIMTQSPQTSAFASGLSELPSLESMTSAAAGADAKRRLWSLLVAQRPV